MLVRTRSSADSKGRELDGYAARKTKGVARRKHHGKLVGFGCTGTQQQPAAWHVACEKRWQSCFCELRTVLHCDCARTVNRIVDSNNNSATVQLIILAVNKNK